VYAIMSAAAGALEIGTAVNILAVVIFLAVYAIAGLIGGVEVAFVYNKVVEIIGGVVLKFEE